MIIVSRVTSLSAAGRSYGETSSQNQASQSANGRILSQPSSSPDKDAITYPDDIFRDSYGNIVTPYTTLVEDTAAYQTSSAKPSNVGVFTDVNKDNGQHLQFVIPSYSDGITELQGPYKPSSANAAIVPPFQSLLPPLSSGNFNYPNLDTHKIQADNSYQNEISGSFPSSSQSINPVPTGPTVITTNGHIGSVNSSPSIYTPNLQVPISSPSAVANQPIQPTKYDQQNQPNSGTSTIFTKPGFVSVPNTPIVNGVQGSSDFSAIHVSSSESNAPISSFPLSNTKPLKDTQYVNQIPINIQVDSGKYTGGFGGAPGVLGEQKVAGYAVKPTASKPILSESISPVSNDHPELNSVHTHSSVNSPNHGTPNALQNPPHQVVLPNPNLQAPSTRPNNVNHGSFQFGTAISSNPTPHSQVSNNGKYTNGFGGPPGILSPYDNIKTAKNVGTANIPTSNAGNFNKK